MKTGLARYRTTLYTVVFVLYVIITLLDAFGLRQTASTKIAMIVSLICAMLTGYILVRSSFNRGGSRG